MRDFKIKKFIAELLAKQPDIDKVLGKGNELLGTVHPDVVPNLQNMIKALEDGWEKLKRMANDYSKNLAITLLELQGAEECLGRLSRWAEMEKLAPTQPKPGDTESFNFETLSLEDTAVAQLAEYQVATVVSYYNF